MDIRATSLAVGFGVLALVGSAHPTLAQVFIGPIPPQYQTFFDQFEAKYSGEVRTIAGTPYRIMLDDPRPEGFDRDLPTLWDPESRCQTTLTKPQLVSRTPRRYRLRVRPEVKRKETMCQRFGSIAPMAGSLYVTVRHGAGEEIAYEIEVVHPNLDLTGSGDAGETVFARGRITPGKKLADFPDRGWFDEPRFRNERKLARYPAFLEGEITDRHGVRRALSLHRILFRGEKIATIGIHDGYSGCLYLSDSRIRKKDLRRAFTISPRKSSPSAVLSLDCDERRSIQVPSGIPTPTSFSMIGSLELRPSGAGEWQAALQSPPFFDSAGALGVGKLNQVAGQPLVVDYTPADGLRTLAGHHLVTNFGIFRLKAKTGTSVAIYLVEGTDLAGPFSRGEAIGSAYWDPERQTLSASFLSRAVSGHCETEGSGATRGYRPKFSAGSHASGRYWVGGGHIGYSGARICATELLDADTCKRSECLRWRDEVPYFDETWLLVEDEGLAKRLYATVPKWTRANLRLPTGGRRARTTGRSPSYFSPGSCGIESCYDQRMREIRDDYVQSLW